MGKKINVPHGKMWRATTAETVASSGSRHKKPGFLYIECERWFDVRDIARRYFGSEVEITPVSSLAASYPRVQVRWVGTASGLSDLRKQVRIVNKSASNTKWRELSEFPR